MKWKEFLESAYWKYKQLSEKQLNNSHYEYFFTTYFSIDKEEYRGKSILDIGCGPRGSLEWAIHARERTGLDPLADRYRSLGTGKHQMAYVKAYAEHIPFPEGHFDVVSAFNSLDHVENLPACCAEIQRVLKPGGEFLLIVDIHPYPTPTEPVSIPWDILGSAFPEMIIVEEKHLKRVYPTKIYQNLRLNLPVNTTRPASGVLAARLRKKAPADTG